MLVFIYRGMSYQCNNWAAVCVCVFCVWSFCGPLLPVIVAFPKDLPLVTATPPSEAQGGSISFRFASVSHLAPKLKTFPGTTLVQF